MNLEFTLDEMIKALEKMGYKVVEEEAEFETDVVGNFSRTAKYPVYNVYFPGEERPMAEWIDSTNGRVAYTFSRLLHKKLLSLF